MSAARLIQSFPAPREVLRWTPAHSLGEFRARLDRRNQATANGVSLGECLAALGSIGRGHYPRDHRAVQVLGAAGLVLCRGRKVTITTDGVQVLRESGGVA